MKGKLMTHRCMDKACGYEETSHKLRDGMRCPKCNGPVFSYLVKKEKIKKHPPVKKF